MTPLLRILPAAALTVAASSPALACNQTGYLAEICFMASDFCPDEYAKADGTLLVISEYSALYALFGTAYGGDGQTTFALPDLRGRSPVGLGDSYYTTVTQGLKRGTNTTTLAINQISPHDHLVQLSDMTGTATLRANDSAGGLTSPAGAYPGVGQTTQSPPYEAATTVAVVDPTGTQTSTDTAMSAVGIVGTVETSGVSARTGVAGGSQPFISVAPRQGLTACIRTSGLFPPRN